MLDVRAILKRVGLTAIYVTHDQTEAFAVGDRLAVMNAGRIEQTGSPQAIYNRPATPFVARFLGFHNLIPGRVVAGGAVETPAGLFRPEGALPPVGSAVMLLIRPSGEWFDPTANPPESAVNRIDGVIEAITFRGRYSQIWLSAGGRRLLFEEAGGVPFRPGDPVQVGVSPDQLQLYESARSDETNPRNPAYG
jgi:ABC-type Fe3+/spermidine/putrescine transport system ATPase subunit